MVGGWCWQAYRVCAATASLRATRAKASRGQSGTTGVVILAAVAVVLAGSVGVLVFSELSETSDDEPVVASVASDVRGGTVTLSHGGGDTLDPESVAVVLDTKGATQTVSLAASPDADGNFSAGDRWRLGATLPLSGQVRVVAVYEPTNVRLHEASYTPAGTPTSPAESALTGLDIAGQGSGATLAVGDDRDIAVGVENVGATNDSFAVTLGVGSAVTRTQSTGTLSKGTRQRVTFAGVTAGLAAGTYDVTVSTANASITGSLTVARPLDSAFAAGLKNTSVVVRDRTSDWRVERVLGDASGEVRGLSWSPDCSHLAYASFAGQVSVVDAATWQVEQTLDADAPVVSVAWSPDGSRLAYGSRNGTVFVHETTGWSRLKTLTEAGGSAWALTWSPDSSQLAYGSDGVYVHDASDWTLAQTLRGGVVDSVAWSPDGSRLAFGDIGGDVFVHDTGDWTQETALDDAGAIARSLAWAPDSASLAVGSGDSTVYVYDRTGWSLAESLGAASADVQSVAWSADGSQLVAGSDDGTVSVYETSGYTVARTLTGTSPIRSVALASAST